MKKDKIVAYIIITLFALTIIMPIIYVWLDYTNNLKKVMIRVPYAFVTLESNQLITEEQISYKNIKKIDVPDNIIHNANDIIGKCVKEGIAIEKDSYIKINQLKDCENITN